MPDHDPVPPRPAPRDAPPWGAAPSGSDDATGSPADSEAPGGSRYRRPERPAPSPTEARPLPEIPETVSTHVRNGGDPGTAIRPASSPGSPSLVEPLAALAAAFQANADALRKSQELQSELSHALARADRSEVLLQSTGALNDTFRHLTTIQRGLLGKIEETDEKAQKGRWFLPALVLTALAVVGVVAWLLLDRMNGVEASGALTGDMATQLARTARDARDEAKHDAEKGFATERKALEEELTRLREEREGLLTRSKAAETDRDAERAGRQAAETDLAGIRQEVQGARTEVLKIKAIEDESFRLRAELAAKDPEMERLRRELTEEKRTNADLRARLADVGMGRVPAPEAGTPPTERPSAPDAPATPPSEREDDRSLTRDRRQIDSVVLRVNELLQLGVVGRADYYQVTKVGSMGPTRLVDVTASHFGPQGKLLNTIRAKDLRVLADRSRRVVEFSFREGSLDYGTTSIPFPNGVFSAIVAEGDLAAWTGSGLSLVAAK